MHELIGHKILKVENAVNRFSGLYRITTDSKVFYYHEYVECCNNLSVEWVNIDQLLGQVVTSVESKKVIEDVFVDEFYDDDDNVTRRIATTTDIFGYTIKTTKGWADVVIRNSYGMIHYVGKLVLVDEEDDSDFIEEIETYPNLRWESVKCFDSN